MHSLCILYAVHWLLFVIILLFILLFIIRACFMLLFFFLMAAFISSFISAFFMHSLCIRWASSLCIRHASTMHPNVHQRFSVRFLFFFVPYSFSLLYSLHAPKKHRSTQRPILGRYRLISAVLVVRPIFFRVRIRSLSVLILFSSIHYSYIYACVWSCDPRASYRFLYFRYKIGANG